MSGATMPAAAPVALAVIPAMPPPWPGGWGVIINYHPLLAYTLTAALGSGRVGEAWVVCADLETEAIALEYGARCLRLDNRAGAGTPADVRRMVAHADRAADGHWSQVAVLPPEFPLRGAETVDEALALLSRPEVAEVRAGAGCGAIEAGSSQATPLNEGDIGQAGASGHAAVRCWASCHADGDEAALPRAGGEAVAVLPMSREAAWRVADETDLWLAEALIRRGLCANRPVIAAPAYRIESGGHPQAPGLLFTAPHSFLESQKRRLEERFRTTYAYRAPAATVRDLLGTARVWVTSTCPPYDIDRTFFDAAPRLQLLATPSTGTNHLDAAAAHARGIRVLSLKDSPVIDRIHASSEHSFALLLAMMRRIPEVSEAARFGVWREREAEFRTVEVSGKTIGIIGYGRIGRKMSRFAHAFDMRVVAHDPYRRVDDPWVTQVDKLTTLLTESDMVCLHVHLNEETRSWFGRAMFAAMKPGACFLNTSRGEIVDEAAMVEALQSGHLAAAAVDVITDEHLSDKWAHPVVAYARANRNLLLTPHVAGLTVESERKAADDIIDQIMQAFRPEGTTCS